jgi:hypothetical protein
MPRVVLAVALTSALVLAARPLDPARSTRASGRIEAEIVPAALARDAANSSRAHQETPDAVRAPADVAGRLMRASRETASAEITGRRHVARRGHGLALASNRESLFMPLAAIQRAVFHGVSVPSALCQRADVRARTVAIPAPPCRTTALVVAPSSLPSARLDVTQAP